MVELLEELLEEPVDDPPEPPTVVELDVEEDVEELSPLFIVVEVEEDVSSPLFVVVKLPFGSSCTIQEESKAVIIATAKIIESNLNVNLLRIFNLYSFILFQYSFAARSVLLSP